MLLVPRGIAQHAAEPAIDLLELGDKLRRKLKRVHPSLQCSRNDLVINVSEVPNILDIILQGTGQESVQDVKRDVHTSVTWTCRSGLHAIRIHNAHPSHKCHVPMWL